jgi:hypothetical protein
MPATTQIEELSKALGVIALDKNIRAYLQKNDPKALEQVEFAIARHGTQVVWSLVISQLEAEMLSR